MQTYSTRVASGRSIEGDDVWDRCFEGDVVWYRRIDVNVVWYRTIDGDVVWYRRNDVDVVWYRTIDGDVVWYRRIDGDVVWERHIVRVNIRNKLSGEKKGDKVFPDLVLCVISQSANYDKFHYFCSYVDCFTSSFFGFDSSDQSFWISIQRSTSNNLFHSCKHITIPVLGIYFRKIYLL